MNSSTALTLSHDRVRERGVTQYDLLENTLLIRKRPRQLRRAILAAAGALSVAIALSACGTGPSLPGVATASTHSAAANSSGAGSAQGAPLLAYSSCMRSHGVPNFPDPTSSEGIPKAAAVSALRAVGDAQAKAATNDCNHLLPAGGKLSAQPAQTVTPQDQRYYLSAAACMRSHGFPSFPDPVFSTGTVHFPMPGSIDTNSTQFTQAKATCTKLIPAGLPESGLGQ